MAKKYLMGLDLGTDSVGWCVTDERNEIVRKGGKSLWGVRLFDEAQSRKERRLHRGARRRINRQKERIDLLQSLFAEEMKAIDPNFFIRLNNSFYHIEDKDERVRGEDGTLFANVKGLADKDFYKQFPTIYHLRDALMRQNGKADVRLLYLALHHMIKYRGNFLLEGENVDVRGGGEVVKAFAAIDEALNLMGKKPTGFSVGKMEDFRAIVKTSHGIAALKTKLAALLASEDRYVSKDVIVPLLAGSNNVNVAKIFGLDEEDEDEGSLDVKSIGVRGSAFDETLGKLASHFEGRPELTIVKEAKIISDFIVMNQTMGDFSSISAAMVARYDQHQKDLRELKKYVKEHCPGKYGECFRQHKDKLNNYAAYVGMTSVKGKRERFAHCAQKDFYSYIRSEIFGLKKSENAPESSIKAANVAEPAAKAIDPADLFVKEICDRMAEGSYLPRQNSSDNGVFPYQLNLLEMKAILKKQETYYPFLLAKDEEGHSGEEKIISLLTYRIPYYVGPLISPKPGAERSSFAWVSRHEGKIYPWNFKEKIDFDASAENFIRRMLNKCTYIPGADCLPKFSLLYSEYEVLSFLNDIKINGKTLPAEKTPGEVSKQEIIDEFFKMKPANKRAFLSYLKTKLGPSFLEENLTFRRGKPIDEIPCSLKSYQDFCRIFGASYVQTHADLIERIILDLSVFEDRDIVERRLRKIHGLTDENAIRAIKALPYAGFGRLSKDLLLLTSKYVDRGTGEVTEITFLEAMRLTGLNLMELLNDQSFEFQAKIDELKKEATQNLGGGEDRFAQAKAFIEEQYVSPNMKRPLLQAYEIIEEAQRIIKAPIDEYCIECARGGNPDEKGKKKPTRLDNLIKMYEEAVKKTKEIIAKGETEEKDKGVYAAANSYKDELADGLNNLSDYKKQVKALDFRSDKLFLYFTQLGRCMYSLQPIDLGSLFSDKMIYDIDHIIPQDVVKDDSLSNRVLEYKSKNNDKQDTYPLPNGFLAPGAHAFYRYLRRIGLIDQKKYDALMRQPGNELTEDEIMQFTNRQLVSTNQAVIGLINVINAFEKRADGSAPHVIYSKARMVSDFRDKFVLLKARDANSFHHAHDAYLNIIVGRAMDSYYGFPFRKGRIEELKNNHQTTNPDRIFDDVTAEAKAKGIVRKPITDREGNVVWEVGKTIGAIEKNIYHRFDVMVTVRQFVKSGLFNKVGIHPHFEDKGSNLIPLKKGLDPAKYGGYSDLTNGFFALLEEDRGKKGLKARLLPIPNMYAKPNDSEAILRYAREAVGLKITKILIPCLRINAIVDFGKCRIALTGKNNDSLTYASSLSQIRFSEEEQKTIRYVSKFNERILKEYAKDIKPFEPDFEEKVKDILKAYDTEGSLIISPASNKTRNRPLILTREMEDHLFQKIGEKLTSELFSALSSVRDIGSLALSDEGKRIFAESPAATRSIILGELLKMCAPNSSAVGNFSLLGKQKTVSKRYISNYLSNCRIINQSVTGYYDKVIWESE